MVKAFIGAAPFDRSESRTAQRNGSGSRTLTTTAGDLHLSIPKLRQGSCLLPYSRLSDDSPAFGSATAYAPRRRARSATQASDGLSMEWKPSPARDDAFQALRVQNGH